MVRHAVLIRIYAGSNPASPVGRVQDRYVRYDSNIPTPGSAWYTESLLYVWCKSTVSRLPLLRCKSESHIICVDQSRLSAWPETSGDSADMSSSLIESCAVFAMVPAYRRSMAALCIIMRVFGRPRRSLVRTKPDA